MFNLGAKLHKISYNQREFLLINAKRGRTSLSVLPSSKNKIQKTKKVDCASPLVGHHISFAVCIEEIRSFYLIRDAPIAVVFE